MFKLDKVVLVKLVEADADRFFELYGNRKVNGGENPFLPDEGPIDFIRRIISHCELIFSIRLAQNPGIMIGDCAMHHWNPDKKEIEIGGSLYPEYWGKGYMRYAFIILETIAKKKYNVNRIIGKTKPNNTKAIKLVEKLGFKMIDASTTEVVMLKETA